jgi:hypothetical protein
LLPNQIAPSASSRIVRPLGLSSPSATPNDENRSPSKRANPQVVAIQISPRRSWWTSQI